MSLSTRRSWRPRSLRFIDPPCRIRAWYLFRHVKNNTKSQGHEAELLCVLVPWCFSSAEAQHGFAGELEAAAGGLDFAEETARVGAVAGGAAQALAVARPPVVEERHRALADVLADHRRERHQLVLVLGVHQEFD